MNTITQLVAPDEYGDGINNTSNDISEQQQALNLLLIDGISSDVSSDLSDKLRKLTSSSVEITQGCETLFTKVSVMQPDVLILAVDKLEPSIIEELVKVNNNCPLPVIVVTSEYQPELLDKVIRAGVSSYLVDNVSLQRLSVIVDLSIARFKQERLLMSELQETKDKLSERKIIARAKGILMEKKNLSEEEAYSQMRRTAMDQGQSMADLSKKIISVFEMLD